MRNLNWIALIGIGLLGSFFEAAPAAEREPVVVTLDEEGSSINDVGFLLTPSVNAVVQLWGNPDRVKNLANDIRIWDSLGIRAYSAPGTTFVDSLTFTMQKQESELSAREIFTGQVNLEEGSITQKSTVNDLKKLGFEAVENLPKFYRFESLVASILAEIDPANGALVTLSVEFSI